MKRGLNNLRRLNGIVPGSKFAGDKSSPEYLSEYDSAVELLESIPKNLMENNKGLGDIISPEEVEETLIQDFFNKTVRYSDNPESIEQINRKTFDLKKDLSVYMSNLLRGGLEGIEKLLEGVIRGKEIEKPLGMVYSNLRDYILLSCFTRLVFSDIKEIRESRKSSSWNYSSPSEFSLVSSRVMCLEDYKNHTSKSPEETKEQLKEKRDGIKKLTYLTAYRCLKSPDELITQILTGLPDHEYGYEHFIWNIKGTSINSEGTSLGCLIKEDSILVPPTVLKLLKTDEEEIITDSKGIPILGSIEITLEARTNKRRWSKRYLFIANRFFPLNSSRKLEKEDVWVEIESEIKEQPYRTQEDEDMEPIEMETMLEAYKEIFFGEFKPGLDAEFKEWCTESLY